MKVLICEDEEIMLTALEFRLKKQGLNVIVAEDGKRALEQIKQEQPDIIITGLMMPFMNGLDLITHVRHQLNNQSPIIIISALDKGDVIIQAFRLGIADFIIKPFKPEELILRIQRVIQQMNEEEIEVLL